MKKILILMLLILSLTVCSHAATTFLDPRGNSTVVTSNLYFISNYANSLSYAKTQIGDASATLVINRVVLLDASTMPSNIAVYVMKEGGIVGGGTLAVSGTFDAGLYQVFDSSTNITGVKEAYPEWWGYSGTVDDSAYISAAQTAVYSATTGRRGRVILGPKKYTLASKLDGSNKPGWTLVGAGAGYSVWGFGSTGTQIINKVTSGPAIDIVGSPGARLEGFEMTGDATAVGHILLGYDASNNAGMFHAYLGDLRLNWSDYTNCPSANSSLGCYGIVNIGGENVTYGRLDVEATIPMIDSTTADMSWIMGDAATTYNFKSSANPRLTTSWTLGVNKHQGHANFNAVGFHRPSRAMYNVNNMEWSAGRTSSSSSGLASDGSYNFGVQYYSGYDNRLHWLSEGQTQSLIIGYDLGSTFQMTAKDATTGITLAPAVGFYGNQGTNNTDIRVNLTENRYAFGTSIVSAFTGSIRNTRLLSDQQNTGMVMEPSPNLFLRLYRGVKYCGVSGCVDMDGLANYATWNFGPIAADASTTTTITVHDASPGDTCLAAHTGATSAGDVLTCQVASYSGTTRLGTVNVLYFNRTNGDRSPSGILTVKTFK